MLFSNLTPDILIARLIALLIAFTVHEFSHAWSADLLGDDTPRIEGRLTLNPLAHLDLLGSLMVLFAGFGWAKPVRINPYLVNRRNRAGVMWVSLAGPVSNLLLAIVAAIPVRLGLLSVNSLSGNLFPSPGLILNEFIVLNILLFFFNLVPLFPLDGEKILTYFLPPAGQDFMEQLRPYSSFILIGVFFLLPSMGVNIMGPVIWTPASFVYRTLLGF